MSVNIKYVGFKSKARCAGPLSLKLHREMANSVDDPLKTHYRISGTELDDYRDSHSPKAVKALCPRKVAQDF